MDESFLNENILSEYVPEFMRHSKSFTHDQLYISIRPILGYKNLVRHETKRIIQLQHKKPKKVHKDTIKNNQRLKSSVLEKILREFIRKEQVSSYSFTNLTNHGRVNVIPKLAQLFNLELSLIGGNPKNVLLTRTKNTSIPTALKKHKQQQKTPIKRAIRNNNTKNTHYEKTVVGIVGADATPISSSNVGHRMLAAMGWKQGDAIGSNENGIKEPIQVTIRPKNRGLGA
ncbi:G-patch-domain-containing protein [Backusella circina FSU 941]|nr:G-patch-domain-containing protein [Backusella circina FSU 941]